MNNFLNISGTIDEITVSHQDVHGQDIYKAFVTMKVKKKNIKIPVYFKDNVRLVYNLKDGSHINAFGEIRTKNIKTDIGVKLIVYGYLTQANQHVSQFNETKLKGKIVKINKVTNKSGHNICNDIIMVERNNGTEKDFIPCVGHNLNANILRDIPLKTNVEITGMFVNRKYWDKVNQCERETYEVLVKDIKVISNGN